MNKKDIIDFFNTKASVWDDESLRDDKTIAQILDMADVSAGKDVLDVACGTGFLFDDYYKRNVSSLTGIDISSEMLKVCLKKYPDAHLICDDAESHAFNRKFDVIIIHNAFPHFCNCEALFKNLVSALKENGRITVSHDMSREALNKFHDKHAVKVSNPLPDAYELKSIMDNFVYTDRIISDTKMYLVSGIKK